MRPILLSIFALTFSPAFALAGIAFAPASTVSTPAPQPATSSPLESILAAVPAVATTASAAKQRWVMDALGQFNDRATLKARTALDAWQQRGAAALSAAPGQPTQADADALEKLPPAQRMAAAIALAQRMQQAQRTDIATHSQNANDGARQYALMQESQKLDVLKAKLMEDQSLANLGQALATRRAALQADLQTRLQGCPSIGVEQQDAGCLRGVLAQARPRFETAAADYLRKASAALTNQRQTVWAAVRRAEAVAAPLRSQRGPIIQGKVEACDASIQALLSRIIDQTAETTRNAAALEDDLQLRN